MCKLPTHAVSCAPLQRYDVIVADNFHPARSGSGSLYTVEHFTAVRERLAQGGLFCQCLPLHQLDLPTLRSIVQSYLAAFPQGRALLATNSLTTPVIGLVSRAGGKAFEARSGEAFTVPARAFGLVDKLSVLGSLIAGPEALSGFAKRAAGAAFNARLTSYVAARRRFLAAGLAVRPESDPHRMLDQRRARTARQQPRVRESDTPSLRRRPRRTVASCSRPRSRAGHRRA